MTFLIEDKGKRQSAYETIMVTNPKAFSVLANDLTQRIIKELAIEPACPMDVARRLKEHEQKIYYHIRKLEKLGIIKIDRMEERVGAMAKIYSVRSPVIAMKMFDRKHVANLKLKVRESKFLEPFVKDGKLNSIIVVGSPDPHGKYKAPASDGYCAIDLCLFLGQFITDAKQPYYKLDTQVRDKDLKKNLIVIGGPKTNMIAAKINRKLPIYFDYSDKFKEWSIVSGLTKTTYRDKFIGFITRIPNPFAKDKEILVLSGKGFRGSRAAILALIKYMKEIQKGNLENPAVIAKVVKGIDVDSDEIIDDVEFLE